MKTKRSAFNLIELTLAIAVVGIGIASVMALFIPAIDSTKKSIADNYTADVANTFSTYVRGELAKQWNYTNFPTSSSLTPESDLTDDIPSKWNTSDSNRIIPNTGIYRGADSKYFRIQVGPEFTGHIRIWYEQINKANSNGAPNAFHTTESNQTIEPENMLRFYFELSWPATKPFTAREKRLYVTEIFKLNQTSKR